MPPRSKVTAEDFMRLQLVSDPQISPDSERVAFVKKSVDAARSKYRSEIWVAPTLEGEPRRFTGSDSNDSHPRWSPDGSRLAFLSDRRKPKSQLFTIPTDGGEPTPLTNLDREGSIEGFRWSPDGTKIAFLFRETPEGYRKEQIEERQKQELPSPPRVHTTLNYRHDGSGFVADAFAQIWIADAQTGDCTPLTTGLFDCELPVWSPDSTSLAFLSDRRADRDIAPHYDDALWLLPAAGGELTRIPAPPGPKHGLVWSPDGARFAYLGNPDLTDTWGTNNPRVCVLPAAGGESAHDLTGALDLYVGYASLSDSHEVGAGDTVQWNAGSDTLFFPVSARGDTRLYRMSAEGGQVLALSPAQAEMGGFTLSPNGRAAIALGTPLCPQELAVLLEPPQAGEGVQVRARTDFNRALMQATEVTAPEAITIPNGAGGTVEGWLLKPADLNHPAQTYPAILYVHGGPHAQYGNILMHEFQFLAANGYVVVYVNPRGSVGYGEAHTKAIKGDWGHRDYEDILAAADYAAELPYVDAQRMAIMGGSYGGYMTAWAVGHTDRFACAIADRLVGNLHSMAGTTDFAWRHGAYFAGDSWNNPTPLWEHSPLAFAGRIDTPLLIIHSDGDLRCPVGQAEELFAALRMQGKAVEFVRYPAETSHGMSRNGPPSLRLDRLQRNLSWLNRWLKKESPSGG
jgi:dipeptidyl aminopeptidase/acylaminoacyl peptidase